MAQRNDNLPISVFEHDAIWFDRGSPRLTEDQFKALERYHGAGVPYYNLVYHGIQFNEYVGVLQVGKTVIEVLPKADKQGVISSGEKVWRDLLIDMLRAVHSFDIDSTSESSLKIKPNSILDLYIEIFIQELEFLIHSGLIKKYRRTEGNAKALKGSLHFPKHIKKNLIHKENFYVKHTTYDTEHLLHLILFKALKLINEINVNPGLDSRIGSLLLNFPEMPDLRVNEGTFEKIVFNRKSERYRKSIEISKLLLLQFHPDLSQGKNHVLALMFDMNLLWERFILASLKRHLSGMRVMGQSSAPFWKPQKGNLRSIRPDIHISLGDRNFVLDTKWKLVNNKPSMDDIRQMYAYHHYFEAEKVALIFPGINSNEMGFFQPIKKSNHSENLECGMIFIPLNFNVKVWMKEISLNLLSWINS